VRHEQALNTSVARDLSSPSRGAVMGMACPRSLLLTERCFVNQEIRIPSVRHRRPARTGVSCIHDRAARTRTTHKIRSPYHLPVDLDILPPVKPPEQGPLGNTRRTRPINVEAT
jgi:hypothetical protein